MAKEMLRFDGLHPWPVDIEVVECIVEDKIFDLHNECTLLRTEITCAPEVDLCFSFTKDSDGTMVDLIFRNVNCLVFGQDSSPSAGRGDQNETPVGWTPSEVETFYGVEYSVVDGEAFFSLSTIIGEYRFVADVVSFAFQSGEGHQGD